MLIDIDEDKSIFTYQEYDKIKYSKQIEIGVKTIDSDITKFLIEEFGLRIGKRTARTIWMELANLLPQENQPKMFIRCRNTSSNELQGIFVTSEQILRAILGHIEIILNEAHEISRRITKENRTVGTECKILLSGNGRKLKGLAQVLSEKTVLPVITSL